MARRKPNKLQIVVSSVDEAQETMRKIAEHELAIETEENVADEAIAAARLKCQEDCASHLVAIKALSLGLEAFAKANKETLFSATKKSIETLFGSYGFRKSTSIKAVKGKKLADVLAAVQKLKMRKAMHVKKTLNKEYLRTLDAEALTKINARLKSEDTFWYEVDKTKVDIDATLSEGGA